MDSAAEPRPPRRVDGQLPIADHAVIGNKRTAALVGLDGSIGWLAHPTLSSPSVFASVLDPRRGGGCELCPEVPFEASRRYLPETNVLETTFRTGTGAVRVTDALVHPTDRRPPFNQLVRRVDGLAGAVAVRWSVSPRFGYGATAGTAARRGQGVPTFEHASTVLAVESHDAGQPSQDAAGVSGRFRVTPGTTAVLAIGLFEREPLSWSDKDRLLERIEQTCAMWRSLAGRLTYDGPWRDEVVRSALALDLLVDETTGGIAAAATMALPERVGGPRNYDYRYAWLRDASLTLGAMSRVGLRDQVHVSMGWMLRAAAGTHPWLRPMYTLAGGADLPDAELDLAGYRGSRPVTLGNPAQSQLQLGNFGDVFAMAARFVRDGGSLHPAGARQLAELADHLCRVWHRPDAGVWELGQPEQFTQSKLACWTALDTALDLVERGELPAGGAGRWNKAREAIGRFLLDRCWSPQRRTWLRAAGADELDAGVLLAVRDALPAFGADRLSSTVDALRAGLAADEHGHLLYRYTGMAQQEGAFLVCSCWLAEGLAHLGRLDEAAEVVEAVLACASDVGLLSEEVDPATGEQLGNVPQALSHLGLVNAAMTIAELGG